MSEIPSLLLRDFLVADFEKAWNAMAVVDFAPDTGGNFTFARQAMLLLELASRAASTEPATFARFSDALAEIEPGYFTPLPEGSDIGFPFR